MEKRLICSTNTSLRLRRTWRYGTMLVFGLGLGMWAQRSFESSPGKAPVDAHSASRLATESPFDSQPPWGELEITESTLEPSDELLPQIQQCLKDPEWFFAGYSLEGATNLLRACQLSEADLAHLMKNAEWDAVWPGLPGHRYAPVSFADLTPVGVRVFPPPELVFQLGAAARQRIYAVLSASPENSSHQFPFRFVPENLDCWLAQCQLSSDKTEAIRELIYTNENTACLADVEPLRHVLSGGELQSLLKRIYQTSTLVVRLRLTSPSDLDRLAGYWGRNGRGRLILPYLLGLAKSHSRPAVSVSFMMPGFARTRLYTFPDPARDPAVLPKHGLWTALNFFNEQPDDRYLNDDYAGQVLRTEFEASPHAPSYGDLIALTSPSGSLVHASVYIAEDVVFTRSGLSPLGPWVLMRIPELVAKFGALGPVQSVVYRRKHA